MFSVFSASRYSLKFRIAAAASACTVLLAGCSDRNGAFSAEQSGSSSVYSDSDSANSGSADNTNSGNVGGENSGGAISSDEPYTESEGEHSMIIPPDGESLPSDNDTSGSQSSSGNGGNNSNSNGNSSSGQGGVTPSKPSGTTSKPNGGGTTSTGNQTEGTKSTGKFNYGEALQKSILFYELQRSGDIDEKTIRTNWRGDSGLNDGADVVLDLTGGLYDAGDNVKFNLPMAYTAAMLAWSVYEDKDAYQKSGQLSYALGNIKWICDYLIKCHPSADVYYYQVGDGNADHAWWGPAEVMQMNRPAYKVDRNAPGSTVAGEAAAALAACAAVYKDIDKAYADKCLTHAKQLYNFAETTKSDAGYTAANGFYNSWSGFYDELTWAAAWLYIATKDSSYLNKAKQYEPQCGGDYKWTMCWDDKYTGAVCLLAELTAWLQQWGSLRYATTAAFIALSWAESGKCTSSRVSEYTQFAESQVDYALGSTGRSFVVGFGVNPPEHPHHRTAQGSWADNMNEPNYHRHTLYGALVGGPADASDNYTDSVGDYTANEVACDYNAGFTGALAKMYNKYGGQTLKNFGAVEKVGEEMYVEHRINASGNDFTEIKAVVYNKSAWPARVAENLELRYFVDLSELSDPASLKVSLNYAEGASFGGLYEWNKSKNLYYVSIRFNSKIYPGGQSAYKKEVQFRMSAAGWNPDNDPSYKEIKGSNGSELVRAASVGLFENNTLVFGTLPDGKSAGTVTPPASSGSKSSQSTQSAQSAQNTQSSTQSSPNNPTGAKDGLKVSLSQNQTSGQGNSIQFNVEISNGTGSDISLSQLEIDYFFTKDGKDALNFACYHAAVQGGAYEAVTDKVRAEFSGVSGKNADTKCAVKFSGGTLPAGSSLTVQCNINPADWSNFDLGNDYSAGNADNLYITKNGSPLFGSRP